MVLFLLFCAGSVYSGADADDGLALAPLGRVERSDRVIERDDLVDIRAEPTVADSLDNLDELRWH
jgi:hypothetical protein